MPTEITKQLVRATHETVMRYFKEICQIPRGSGKEQQIAGYLLDFAQKHGYETRQSSETIRGKQTHDVVIIKPASPGYEHLEPVILQAHIDMVCQKVEGSAHDFDRDPIVTYMDGDWMKAEGTTLGADDGIGMACMLAILENQSLSHPKIEALFTSDEEDGMTGAMAISRTLVQGNRLINIDTETEGTMYYGCAGGIDADFRLSITHVPIPNGHECLALTLSGLHGGHSGVEIHRGYANAHKLMARTLRAISDACPTLLVEITGGDKRNVIALAASAVIAVAESDGAVVRKIAEEQIAIFRNEYQGIEELDGKVMQLTVTPATDRPRRALSPASFETLLRLLLVIPNGVLAMHGLVPGLVETSCNLGVLRQEEAQIALCSLIRSFLRSKKLAVLEQMRHLAALTGAAFSADGDYPDWNPDPGSELIARFQHAYHGAFGTDCKIESIHAGLECGYFKERFPEMDLIACGPTILGAHTPEERLDVAGTERVVELLLLVLRQMDSPAR